MPGWHEKTQSLVEAGKLQSLGIVQEQHPDRAALYMQWQEIDWPVLADPFNLLGVKVVPITLLVDASGVIRFTNPSDQDLKDFVAQDYLKKESDDVDFSFNDSLEGQLEVLKDQPESPVAHFRYGVALRQRFDSAERKEGDFGKAVAAWQKALELKPDQYIWRRRIQQYGPRLDKPYSFYDWVNEARKDLERRGEVPHPLSSEPKGSEFAYPAKAGVAGKKEKKHPDPEGKVSVDAKNLIESSMVIVPSTKGNGDALRVHLRFLPSAGRKVHWTNDAENVSFHFDSTGRFTLYDLEVSKIPVGQATSHEERTIEFEIRAMKGKKLPKVIKGAAYYYVCEGVDGVCQFLRQPLVLQISK